jgi:FHA domain-containing protein
MSAPADAVLSWADPSGESRTIIRPRGGDVAASANAPATPAAEELDLTLDFPAAAPAAAAPPAARAVPAAPPVPLQSAAAPGPTPADMQPPRPAAASQPDAHIAALTAALREGLGVPNLPADALVLTPALMRLMGRLVHEATRGTVDLLMARAALKREIRAEVTMIVSRENNPLKFSPSTEVALGHLLSPPARGFMEADQAMRDAYDDLRAHQFAFLAGMRAALEGILKRFDPAQLEAKLTQRSMLASLIPAKRKAGMWDVFTQLYGQISAEASDDFHELFGKEFLRAYNDHIDQLARDRP